MPDGAYWSSCFEPESAWEQPLPSDVEATSVIDFKCRYSTVTLSDARGESGIVAERVALAIRIPFQDWHRPHHSIGC